MGTLPALQSPRHSRVSGPRLAFGEVPRLSQSPPGAPVLPSCHRWSRTPCSITPAHMQSVQRLSLCAARRKFEMLAAYVRGEEDHIPGASS